MLVETLETTRCIVLLYEYGGLKQLNKMAPFCATLNAENC